MDATNLQTGVAKEWGTPQAPTGGTYSTGTHTLADGASMFYRVWTQPEASAPVLVIMHGLGGHSGWYVDMANTFAGRGLIVYSIDHRTFGQSSGPRGHVLDWQVFPRDASSFLQMVKTRHPDARVHGLGHSMGGLILTFAAAQGAPLDSLILLNPWVRDTAKIGFMNTLRVALGGSRGSSRVIIFPFATSMMTNNPQAQQLLESDPAWVRAQTASLLYQVGLKMRAQVLAQAAKVRQPVMVAQAAADRIVVIAATKQIFSKFPSSDKVYHEYPGYSHDSQFQADRSQLDNDIAEWVRAHSA